MSSNSDCVASGGGEPSRTRDAGALWTIAALLGMQDCVPCKSSGASRPIPPSRVCRPGNNNQVWASVGGVPPGALGGASPLVGAPRRPAEVALPGDEGCESHGFGGGKGSSSASIISRPDSVRSEASTMPACSPSCPSWPSSMPSTPGAPSGPATPCTSSRNTESRGSRRTLDLGEDQARAELGIEAHMELTLVVREWRRVAAAGRAESTRAREVGLLVGRMEAWICSRARAESKSKAFEAMLANVADARGEKAKEEAAGLRRQVEGMRASVGVNVRLKAVLERQARLAVKQEERIGVLRGRAVEAEDEAARAAVVPRAGGVVGEERVASWRRGVVVEEEAEGSARANLLSKAVATTTAAGGGDRDCGEDEARCGGWSILPVAPEHADAGESSLAEAGACGPVWGGHGTFTRPSPLVEMSEAEERLVRSMRMLSAGLRRSGAFVPGA